MADLFELGDLEDILRDPGFDTAAATVARRLASGWLMNATGITAWTAPVSDDLWAWGIELGAIAYRNPAGAASESIDDYSVSHDAARREQILMAARLAYSGAAVPQYSFPEVDWHWDVVPSTAAE